MSACPHCGNENRPTYTHCFSCGRPLVLKATAVGPSGTPTGDGARAVRGPAIALMCLAPVLMLQSAGTIAIGVVHMVAPAQGDGLDGAEGITLVFLSMTLVSSAVIFVGANSMRKLGSYPMAWVAAILAMIPCFTFYCFMPGIAFGIWSITVLNKPEVKAAFAR